MTSESCIPPPDLLHTMSMKDCVFRIETDIAQSREREHMVDAGTELLAADSRRESVLNLKSMLEAGNYEGVLSSAVSKGFLERESSGDSSSISDIIRGNVALYIEQSQNNDDEIQRHFMTLCTGIASLQLFVQNNWTGPPSTEEASQILSDSLQIPQKDLSDQAKAALSPEGSTVYSLVSLPELLLIARAILVDCSNCTSHCKTSGWWKLRCLWIQQQLLDERSPELYNIIIPLSKAIEEDGELMNTEGSVSLPLMFYLECSHIYAFYYEYKLAADSLNRATKLAGLEVNLTGALGKRTRFQVEDKAQMVLNIKRNYEREGTTVEQHECTPDGLPKDLLLDDDTVMNAIKFKEEGANVLPTFTSLEQALVLGLCMEHKRSKPKDVLLTEELMAYIVGILKQPQCWSIQTLALRIRCQLENNKRRTVERAMTQMQVLVDQYSSGTCPVKDRMKLFYAINLPPKWTLEGELAELLMSLGCVSAALEIFVRLQLWEDVVRCFTLLQQPEKAIHIIREQLEIKESALMWCLLGDVTKEKKYYEKAWEVSGHRSTRAMSSLGLLYVNDEEFEKAIECLQVSLDKNFLQYGAWFNLGYAGFKSEKYEVAARAYRRCIQLEIDDAQSWNNLATAYIRLNQKDKAFRTLKEAMRCSFDNWKIWDNFLGVCIDLGEFAESVRAYQRLLNIRTKHVDEAVLQIMVRAVLEDMTDSKGVPVSQLRSQIVDLFDKITSQVTNDASVWSLYGKLLGSCAADNVLENDKALQCLQRAHRLVIQDQRWHKEVSTVVDVIEQTQTLVEAYENCSKAKASSAQVIQLLSSAKLMLKSVITKIKQEHFDAITPPASWTELREPVARLEMKLQELVDRIAQLRS